LKPIIRKGIAISDPPKISSQLVFSSIKINKTGTMPGVSISKKPKVPDMIFINK
jgi:hypothetical protein